MIDALREVHGDFEPYSDDDEAPYHAKDHSTDRPPNSDGLPIVGFVRNPFARELSLYLWQAFIGRNDVRHPSGLSMTAALLSFEQYIAFRVNQRLDDAVKRVVGTQSEFYGDLTPHRLLRYEDLPDAFTSLSFVPEGTALEVNQTTRMGPVNLRTFYTPAARVLVAHYAAADFERFGYDPQEIPE